MPQCIGNSTDKKIWMPLWERTKEIMSKGVRAQQKDNNKHTSTHFLVMEQRHTVFLNVCMYNSTPGCIIQ